MLIVALPAYLILCGVLQVEKGSKAEEVGLKRGDQILEVNGQSFAHMNHAKALEILRQTCHLSITVKSNLLGKLKLFSSCSFAFTSYCANCSVY